MSSRKKRAKFNHEWRKARKVLRLAQSRREWTEDALRLAGRYNIDVPREWVK